MSLIDHPFLAPVKAALSESQNAPTLKDDSFVDRAIATASVSLCDHHERGITNAVQLLVRPIDVRSDESGAHPGESFVMVTITREEMRAMLAWLDEDWEEVVRANGDPNTELIRTA